MTHTIVTTFAMIAVGAAFYSPDSERAFQFVKESDKKYSTTYNGARRVFEAQPHEPVEVDFDC